MTKKPNKSTKLKNIGKDHEASNIKESQDSTTCEDTETLSDKLSKSEEEHKRLENIALRAQADLTNYKKRSLEESTQSIQRNTMGIMLTIIPIIDDFEMALKHVDDNVTNDDFTEGVKLIKRKLLSVLEINSVKPIPVKIGDVFDPNIHEAIQHQESNEATDNTVIHIIRDGYYFREQTLRPVQIIVASTPKE